MRKQVKQRYNISIAKQYTTAQGEQKTQWVNIGTAVMFDDGSIVQNINTLPTGNWWDGTCQLFKQEQRTQQQAPAQQGGYSGGYQQQQRQYPSGYEFDQAPIPTEQDGPILT